MSHFMEVNFYVKIFSRNVVFKIEKKNENEKFDGRAVTIDWIRVFLLYLSGNIIPADYYFHKMTFIFAN